MMKLLTGASEQIVPLLAMFGVTDIKGVCGVDIRIRSKELVNIRVYKEVEANDEQMTASCDYVAVPRSDVPGLQSEGPIAEWDFERDVQQQHEVTLVYINHRSETKEYKIAPKNVYFGNTSYYPDDQWLMEAKDVTRNVMRTFAMARILSWRPA